MIANARVGAIVGLIAAMTLVGAAAAPLPPFSPVGVCGTIVQQTWVPARTERGRPGMSGSLGHDRSFPAHFRVVLENYRGIDGAMARRINGLLGFADVPGPGGAPRQILLLLPQTDPQFLASATSLCVEGFRIRGDEGGTWTSYDRLVPNR